MSTPTQAERKQITDPVEVERQRFRDVLDQMPAYLVLLSSDYRVPFADRFFEERFGKAEGRRCYEYLFNRTEVHRFEPDRGIGDTIPLWRDLACG